MHKITKDPNYIIIQSSTFENLGLVNSSPETYKVEGKKQLQQAV